MTSVKEFRVSQAPTPDELGAGAFNFTDAYSVFDWGPMPDAIPEKGASLCSMGAFTFESLEDAGVPTHYRGVIEDGEVVSLDATSEPPNEMAIDLTQVPDLPQDDRDYDYEAFHEAGGRNYLIPLEVVFRNHVPVGSSLRRRTAPADHGLDVAEWPAEGVALEEPIVEFSTKYEESDRYLDRAEANRIAGRASLDDLEGVARRVNRAITDRAEAVGMTHLDGKIECLYFDGEIRVADVAGTFDENRFRDDGTQISKEVLRQYHKRTQPAWVDAVEAAKTTAKERDVANWKSLCDRTPDPLSDSVIRTAADLYRSGTNRYIGRRVFPEAPSLGDAVTAVRDL
ncbi:MAG: phosphoribosylaminoimidazole-succinocarboxamide synthase [Halobacteriales archaeon]